MQENLRKAENLLAEAESAALVALLAAMVALAFAQVVLRRFGAGVLWGETLLRHLVVWTGFLGAALAAHAEKHFAWEAAHFGAPKSWKAPLRFLSSAAAAAVCAALLRAAWSYAADERAAGGTLLTIGSLSLPAWAAALGIPGGFALVGAHFLFKTADAALEMAAGRR